MASSGLRILDEEDGDSGKSGSSYKMPSIGTAASSKRRVSYFYDPEIGNWHYGQGHPMKPHRVRMAHHLIVSYDLYRQMEIYRPPLIDAAEMTRFHSDDYINFLRVITPDNMYDHLRELQRFAVGEDCPVFDGIFEFNQLATSGSMGGAALINAGRCDVAINWAGGFHHAKKSEASGFCYVNDIVLAILELLKVHRRVLYIDIDIHHGDGVEEAFYTTDRVMCVSFHKYGDFFPGTGHWEDIGYAKGRNTSINFPLHDGMNDEAYRTIFKPIIQEVMARYQPEAVVLELGADSLAGDRLGCFNLSLKGHAECVEFVKSFGLPTILLGGGGYTMRNVARCWTYETSVMLGRSIPDELPYNEYFEYYGPDYRLHIDTTNMENKNDRKYLDDVTAKLLGVLKELEIAPSVGYDTGAAGGVSHPRPMEMDTGAYDDAKDPDERDLEAEDRRAGDEGEMHSGEKDQDHDTVVEGKSSMPSSLAMQDDDGAQGAATGGAASAAAGAAGTGAEAGAGRASSSSSADAAKGASGSAAMEDD